LGEIWIDRPDNIADADAEGGVLVGEETVCRERETEEVETERTHVHSQQSHENMVMPTTAGVWK
jgi:hypothetical protein